MGRCRSGIGRIRRLVRPVDLGVAILLLVAGWRICTLYIPQTANQKEATVITRLLFSDIPPYISRNLRVGQDLFQDGTNTYLGKIVSKEERPAERIVIDSGRLMSLKIPSRLDLHLKVRRRARLVTGPARTGIYLGNSMVHIGDRFAVHTFYTAATAEVDGLALLRK